MLKNARVSPQTRANGPITSQPRAERGTSVALGPGANKDLQPQRGATIFRHTLLRSCQGGPENCFWRIR
jgi:hypothetical protein